MAFGIFLLSKKLSWQLTSISDPRFVWTEPTARAVQRRTAVSLVWHITVHIQRAMLT